MMAFAAIHGTVPGRAPISSAIREAVGATRINYLGYSYGTYLASVYASLFPDRVDRFIMDSNVAPQLVWNAVFAAWGPAVQARFPDFTSWAASNDATYGLGSTPQAVYGLYFTLAARLDANPVTVGGTVYTGNLFRETTRELIETDQYFPTLAALWQALDQASGGSPAPGTRQSDAVRLPMIASIPDEPFVSPRPAQTIPADNATAAGDAVFCDDASWPRDPNFYQQASRIEGALFPVAGAMAADIRPCALWHFEPREPLVTIRPPDSGRILLVNALRDPETPYAGAVQLARELGPRARLLTLDAGGHGFTYLPSRQEHLRRSGGDRVPHRRRAPSPRHDLPTQPSTTQLHGIALTAPTCWDRRSATA
jgi:pimeloyl-ACP methyl ester carboxylesterase